MITAIKRNGKWERTDWLDRLCWRLGPAFIRLNRRLDFFRDRWFPRAEGANAVSGDALEDEREARAAVDGFGLDSLDESKRVKLGGDNGVLPAERDGDGGAQPLQ